ncbi:cell surface protein SprA [bacterium]|nr:cell surface protein SprA [bacterium]
MHKHRSFGSKCVGMFTTFSIFFFLSVSSLHSEIGLRLAEPYSPLAPMRAPRATVLFSQGDSLSQLGPYYPTSIRHDVKIDSAGKTVTARLKYQERDILFPHVMTFGEYLRWRYAYDTAQQWKEYAVTHVSSTAADRARGGLKIETPKIKSKAFENIFGGNTMSLTVNGDITIDASMRNEKRSSVKTAFTRGANTNFQMKQTQRFKVEGKIGENLSIFVDQDSERPFEFENAIKLRYTSQGEDGIVKSIEAGNVSLSLPGTQFVTVSAQNAGLFGIKSELKVGPLDITAIASMEKGQKKKLSLDGGASSENYKIKDYDYKGGTYFFLDGIYRDQFKIIQNGLHVYDSTTVIVDIDVYRSEGRDEISQDYFYSWATVSGDTSTAGQDTLTTDTKKAYPGKFKRLEPFTDYDFNAELGYIVLNQSIRDEQILAVTYAVRNGKKVGTQTKAVTDASGKDIIKIMKLIKPRNPQPVDVTWNLEWRHVYSLGSRNINSEGFELKIFQQTGSGDPKEVMTINGDPTGFLEIFGLDKIDKNGAPAPDNIIDNNENFLNLARGELIFPELRPFDPEEGSSYYELFQDEKLASPEIYDETNQDLIRRSSKFFIEVNSSARGASFNLGMNVIEGSEEVTLNNRKLTKDVDYVIDYFTGSLTMLNEAALDPSARLEINYENQQLFSVDKKTLLGMRAEYTLWESGANRSFIGGTLLYLNQQTLDRRVRITQDAPMRNVVWDVNTAFKFEPAFLDRALDAVPFLHSAGRSSVSFEGEVAQIIPNPNTLNNEKTGDRDGVAYVDDFESARRQITLSIMDKAWQFSAIPDPENRGLDTRGHMYWYNPYDLVSIKEIWPDREVTSNYGNTTTTHVLDMVFYPDPNLADPSRSWFGISQGLSTGYFDQKDSRFLEVWVKGDVGRLHIDLGRISEDAIPNRKLNTEDKFRDELRNQQLEDDEDVGVDNIEGPDPPDLFHPHEPATVTDGVASPYDFWDIHGAEGPLSPPDKVKQEDEPWSYDNWAYKEGSIDYTRYNGTEGSKNSSAYLTPDTEDLNGNSIIDMANDYYEFSFSLDKSSPDVQYIAAGGVTHPHGWALYRLPLNAPSDSLGNPDWSAIENIRIWLDGVDAQEAPAYLRIAEISLTGNEWKLRGVALNDTLQYESSDDSTLTVSVINTHDNSDEYIAPPNVEGVVDPVYNIRSKEQSLVMITDNLASGASAIAEKTMYQEANLLNYKRIKMFVHGGGKLDAFKYAEDSVAFFLQFGSNSNFEAGDYYEIRLPRVYSGWDERNNIDVAFDTLSQMKVTMMTEGLDVMSRKLANGQVLTVVGEPTLSRIRWMVIGIRNNGDAPFSDEIWLDEMRVSNVRKDRGMAWRASADVAISDLFRINADMSKKDADFHTVNERFGQGSNTRSMNWNASVSLHKLLPASWGVNLPFNANYRESNSSPKFLPGSDIFAKRSIITDDSLWNAIQTINTSKGYSVSISKRATSRNFLLKYFVDPVSGRFSYSNSGSSSSTVLSSNSDSYQGSAAYQLNFSGQSYVSPFKWLGQKKYIKPVSELKLYYMPTNLNFDAKASHSEKFTEQRSGLVSGDTTKNFIQSFSTGLKPFKTMSLTYNRSQTSDLRRAPWTEVMESLEPGDVTSKTHSTSASFNPSLFVWFRPTFKYSVNYNWTDNLQMSNQGLDTGKSANKNASINVSGNFDINKMLQSFGGNKRGSSRNTNSRNARPGQARNRRPQAEQAPADSAQTEEKKKSFEIMKIIGFGGKALSRIQPITLSYNTSRKASHNGILGEPSLGYKFDMSRDPRLNISENVTQPFNIGNDARWSLRSGLDVTSQISVNLDYSFSANENKSSSQISGSETNSALLLGKQAIPFPNWTVAWRGLEKIPLLTKFVKSASLNHGFGGQESTTKSNGQATSVTVARDFKPLIGANLTFTNGITSTFQYNSSSSLKEQKQYGKGKTRDLSNSISVTMKYQKKGGLKLPFMKGKKLDNNIDFSMNFSSSSNKSEQQQSEGGNFAETRATSNWSLKPQMSYTFSRTVRGGLYLEFGKRKDKTMGTTTIKAFGLNTVISLAGR